MARIRGLRSGSQHILCRRSTTATHSARADRASVRDWSGMRQGYEPSHTNHTLMLLSLLPFVELRPPPRAVQVRGEVAQQPRRSFGIETNHRKSAGSDRSPGGPVRGQPVPEIAIT